MEAMASAVYSASHNRAPNLAVLAWAGKPTTRRLSRSVLLPISSSSSAKHSDGDGGKGGDRRLHVPRCDSPTPVDGLKIFVPVGPSDLLALQATTAGDETLLPAPATPPTKAPSSESGGDSGDDGRQ